MLDKKSFQHSSTLFLEEGDTATVVTTQRGPEFLHYLVPKGGVTLGAIVNVPVKSKIVLGVVWSNGQSLKTSYKKKRISKVLDLPSLKIEVRNFLQKSSEYYLFPLNTALRLCLNPNLNLEKSYSKYIYQIGPEKVVRLTSQRKRVLDVLSSIRDEPIDKLELKTESNVSDSVIRDLEKKRLLTKTLVPIKYNFATVQVTFSTTLSKFQKKISNELRSKVKSKSYSTTMLKGVTGSGKTEVYMDAIAEAILLGQQVLVVFPEISLSTTFVERLRKRFKSGFAEWHSSISKKEKKRILNSVLDGSLKLVFGARSAVFLPFHNLGLVIVDEEHDSSYKQEEGIRYHGRDMAVLKGFYSQATVILVSATPSLETWVNVLEGKYEGKSLPERFGNASLPKISLVDLRTSDRERNRWISKEIVEKISSKIKKKQQSLLFLNRRGYTPVLVCESCFQMLKCYNCDAKLVEHKLFSALLCHICGARYQSPKICPSCRNECSYIPIGPGIEKIEEETRSLFPDARIELLSSDHYRSLEHLKECFRRITCGEIDIIIGTQLISKGHNFPFLSFVGVIDVDLALKGDDIRAGENTFQLLRQVIGRAGRFEISGEACIQTYFPEDPVMKTLCSDDDEEFMTSQKNLRENARVPPFGRMVALVVSSSTHEAAMNFAKDLTKEILPLQKYDVEIYGPADARISKIRKKYRVRILLKAPKTVSIQPLLKNILEKKKPPRAIYLTIDVDPINFY